MTAVNLTWFPVNWEMHRIYCDRSAVNLTWFPMNWEMHWIYCDRSDVVAANSCK